MVLIVAIYVRIPPFFELQIVYFISKGSNSIIEFDKVESDLELHI